MQTFSHLLVATAIGTLATAFMDAWSLVAARLGMPSSGFRWVGRWMGHLAHGQLRHASIAKAPPVRGELALGWCTHYAVGIAYALVLATAAPGWLADPSALLALAFGLATVAVPFLVMQPAMGAGVAASRTPDPWASRLRSTLNHAAYGLGLYLAAASIARFLQ